MFISLVCVTYMSTDRRCTACGCVSYLQSTYLCLKDLYKYHVVCAVCLLVCGYGINLYNIIMLLHLALFY